MHCDDMVTIALGFALKLHTHCTALLTKLGISTTKNGDSCSFSGISLVFHSVTVMLPFTWPITSIQYHNGPTLL